MVIDSLDAQLALRLVQQDRPALIAYLLASLRRLAGAGVDFAAITANTAHIVFDELAAQSPVPLLSIVEVASPRRSGGVSGGRLSSARALRWRRPYPEVAARQDVSVLVPEEIDRSWIHERHVGELLKGDFRDETRKQFTSLIARLRDEQGIDGVILGGTELPLLLPSALIAGLPALDTTALHVEAILERLRH